MKRMLLMRVILSLSFCFTLCSTAELKSNHLESLRFARQNGQSSSAIRQIANDFSILARLINMISLQESLSDGSTNPDDVIAEFLNIQSSNTVQDLLQMQLDTNGISSKLEKMLIDVGKLGANPLTNSTKVREAVNALSNMKGDVNDLKTGTTADHAKKFKENAELITTAYEPSIQLRDFEDITKLLKTIRDVKPNGTSITVMSKFLTAFETIKRNEDAFSGTLDTFSSYKDATKLKPFWSIKGSYVVLNPILKVSRAAQVLTDNWETFSSLSEKLGILQNDAKILKTHISQNEYHSTLSKSLKLIASLVIDLSNSRVLDRVLTQGFPNGLRDVTRNKNDLKEPWLREKVADGKEMSKLSSLFPLIEKLTEKLSIIDNEWTKFKKSSDKTTHVTELSGILEILAQDGKALGESSGLEGTVGTLTGAIKDLKKIEGSPPFEDFETLYTYSSKVSEYAEKFEKAFEKMSEIGYTKAKEAFSLIYEHSKKAPTGDDTPGMIAIIEKMKGVEGLDDLVKITTIADEELKPLLSKEFATFVKAAPDWTSIKPVQRSLDNTGLQNALEELSDNPVNLDLIDKMLKYGANIRQVQKGSIESLNSVLATLEEIKSGIKQTKEVFGKATRHRRDVGDKSKKLKNSKSIAFDLAKGVNLLQSLATVYERRDELVTAAEFPEIVNSALSSLPSLQSVWTENNRKALKEMPVELGKLEKYAQENQKSTDLIQIGSVFGKASEIKGAPIDNMLIRETVVPALQKNSVLIIQNAASTFSKLGELELDFSKHSTRINAVTLTLPSLRNYFDEVFEISRTPKIVVAQDEKNDQKKDEAQSGLSIEMLGIIAGCIIVFLLLVSGIIFCIVRCRKRRQYNARLNDPETWVLLSFTAENTPNTFGSGFSIEAHKHIIKNNYDSFKKCLKNGAYVDAKLQTDKQSNTMLHEAVLHDKHKYVEALIKHGATREILNHEFETPMQLAVRLKKKKCIKMFKKYEHKKFKIVLPEVFTKNNYLIDVDRAIPIEEHYHGDFFKKFGQYQHEHPKRPTHYVAKTDKDNVLHVKDHHLPMIFSATMIMGHRWLKACLDNPSAIGNNKEWRVTKMSFRGKEYDTLLAIKDYINRMNVPYMFGIGVSYNNHTLAQEWSLMRTVTTQLGVYNGTGEFPFMCPKPGHCYHRDDLPRNFFLYHRNDKAQVQLNFKSTWMDNPAYLFMNTDDFTHFLLDFKIVSKKIEKIDKKNGVVKKKDEKNKRKDKLVSEESCSVTDCSDSCASTMSVGTPVSRTPTSGTPNSRTPNSVTPTSRTPGKNRRH